MQRIRQVARVAVMALAGILIVAGPVANAQLAKATLGGRIVVSDGEVVPGARVLVRQRGTEITYQTTSNADGAFAIMSLSPGTYVAEVYADGFVAWRGEPTELHVGQNLRLTVVMITADSSEEVAATSDDPVNATSSAVDGVISSREIESLPLNGRNFLELALLLPGNAPAARFNLQKGGASLISSVGQFGRTGNVTVDGADNNDDWAGGPVQNVSEEAVEEFQIATNRYSAEFGRTGSSVANILTKSGTNEIHGTAAWFFRDDRLQSLPATFDRAHGSKPPFDRQQYVAAVGGPIVKDGAWWFGSLEYRNQDGAVLAGTRDPATRTIVRAFAPTPLDDLLATVRADWVVSGADYLTFRYSLQHTDDVSQGPITRLTGTTATHQSTEAASQSMLASWRHEFSPSAVNVLNFSFSRFENKEAAVTPSVSYVFPSIDDGAPVLAPTTLRQRKLQISNTTSMLLGAHSLRFGGEVQRVRIDSETGVYQQGSLSFVQDFPDLDRNGDGRMDDADLLFSTSLRGDPYDRLILLHDLSNTHAALFFHDYWQVHPQLRLSLGLRYELDTDVKNVSRGDEVSELVRPFLGGERGADRNNFGPRLGLAWTSRDGRTSVVGAYGIYYDRVLALLRALEETSDGRDFRIEARAGNLYYVDPATGRFAPGAPTLADPFSGFFLSGGAGDINIIDNDLQNPMVQHMGLGVQHEVARDFVVRADYVHNFGTHFIVGRRLGTVYNPAVMASQTVRNLESSVKTKYDGLLVSATKRFSNGSLLRASYTLSKAFTYSNDDQYPYDLAFAVDPQNLQLEYGPAVNDQRHRFNLWGYTLLPLKLRASFIWTMASGVPMDIHLPSDVLLSSGARRIPSLQRNAGGRLFETGADLNRFVESVNRAGGVAGKPLPFVSEDARFNDTFNSLDVRISRSFALGERARVEPMVEIFNLFNFTNVLGSSSSNYSGFNNILIRDSQNPSDPGYLKSSAFGTPITTAGGVFGSGGPRALQLAVRFSF